MIDLGDSIIDLPLLDAATSSVVTSAPSDPLDHSLDDRSLLVELSVDTYDQQLQKGSSSVAEIDSSLRQVLQSIEQVSETSEILSMHSGSVSSIPWLLFLPKGRNTIQHSWISFFIGAVIGRHSSFGRGSLSYLSSSHLSLLYILDVCHNVGVLITPSIHASSFISLFGGGFFPCSFSLFPRFMGDVHLHCTWVPKMA